MRSTSSATTSPVGALARLASSSDGMPVRTPSELLASLAKTPTGEVVALLVDRMGSRAFVPLRIP